MNSRSSKAKAERQFHPAAKTDKSAVMRMVEADALLAQQKTARLRAQRLAHESTIFVSPAKVLKAPPAAG
ncbi:hypothetical protein FHS85_000929 [Rhodoligotrophos appendicifer]|uniref:hypothetical protein n=1 Tax=Rhodoligotrophos appendicifer TaxID=987056 RepID=UPI00117C149B|nr:hypothetical protein [Rhodoligotrophos appendicifer]